eukprot:CAMPEP_0184855726 /NCGR_PEP_ID=MMETSP0580-20130426/869_1 /TAXON_ID=1118495 /ORGANISM="Dactyliosolen fragilissimus" /LENGTH=259 /DNA_ID=CAMNT_0027350303 /DNA_START=33 /DNA_END=812 /DNA_ORIENTATION=+
MLSIENAQVILNDLKAKLDAGDINGGKSILGKMKIGMLDFPSRNAPETQLYTAISISALECGVLLSVADEDLDAFARNVSQLMPLYSSISSPSSTKKCHILGLNLMHLLVENNLSEFHAELELLSSDEASNPYVSFPINLERQLMVGLYDEVLSADSRVPDPSYTFFMESLLQTVQDSIADCLEKSYKTMSINDAVGMMKFDSRDDFMEYVEECRDDWIMEGEDIFFQPPETGSKASDVPSMKLIEQSLSYATELERIV